MSRLGQRELVSGPIRLSKSRISSDVLSLLFGSLSFLPMKLVGVAAPLLSSMILEIFIRFRFMLGFFAF